MGYHPSGAYQPCPVCMPHGMDLAAEPCPPPEAVTSVALPSADLVYLLNQLIM